MTFPRAARRPAGRIILANSHVANRAAREERLIEIMIDAFGASPEEKKRLEALVRGLFPESIARLRRQARAPASMAELASEYALLVEEMGQRRRARAAQWRGGGGPPMATRIEHEGQVALTGQDFRPGEVGRPAPDGYSLDKELARRAGLTRDQVFLLQEFVGRPLGVISVFPRGQTVPVAVDLRAMWQNAAARSGAAQTHLANATRLMSAYEAEVRNGLRLGQEADAALRAGRRNEAAALRAARERSAVAADRLRRDAKSCGDRAYDRVREMFWNDLRRNPDLVHHFEQHMGLKFRRDAQGNPTGMPYFDLGGRRESLTLEHMVRRNDDPRLSIAPDNLSVSPWQENVLLNEAIRANSPLEWR